MIEHYLITECGMNPQEVAAALKGWERIKLVSRGVEVGEGIVRNSEFHIAIRPEHRKRAMTKRAIRDTLAPLLKERVFLVTKSVKGRNAEFLKRIGFTKTRTDDRFDYWWMNELPFGRDK